MKTSQITPGQLYGYSKGAHDPFHPVMALDNKLWTMGEKWAGYNKAYDLSPASAGMRAQEYSYSHNEVGVPILMIRNSGWLFGQGGDNPIVTDPAEILAEAREKLSAEALMKQRKFDNRPKTLCMVEAKRANGKKIMLEVVLTTTLPSRIKGGWTELLEENRKEAAQKAQWAQEKAQRERAVEAANALLKERLDAVLGQEKVSRWSTEERDDCRRIGTGTFQVSEATLIRLLELAEKGMEK
jgi:hypothetical protein